MFHESFQSVTALSPTSSTPVVEGLPLDALIPHRPVLELIMAHLPAHDISLGSLSQVSHSFKAGLADTNLWHRLIKAHFSQVTDIPESVQTAKAHRAYYQLISLKLKIDMLFDAANYTANEGSVEESLRNLFDRPTSPCIFEQDDALDKDIRVLEAWTSSLDIQNPDVVKLLEMVPVLAASFNRVVNTLGTRNHKDDKGRTLLMLAARKGHLPLVQALLSVGADPNIVSAESMDAKQYAFSRGYTEVVQCLSPRCPSPMMKNRSLHRLRESSDTGAKFMRPASVSPVSFR